MKRVEHNRRLQRSPVFLALLLFELVLVLLQLWLFVSALEGILAHETGMAIPSAIVSLVCLAINTWMLVGVERMDHGR